MTLKLPVGEQTLSQLQFSVVYEGVVTSQLPDEGLIVEVPHYDVAVAAAGETDLVVRTDGQRVARRSGGRQLSLDARCGRGQVPYRQSAGFTPHYEGPSIWEELAGADVVVSVLIGRQREVSG